MRICVFAALLIVLMMFSSFSSAATVYSQQYAQLPTEAVPPRATPPVILQEIPPLTGNAILRVYPDGVVEVKVKGCLEQSLGADEEPPPITDVAFDFASHQVDLDVSEFEGSFVMKLHPKVALILSALDLDVRAHSEGLSGNAEILFNMPGYMGVDGTIQTVADETTDETFLDFDMNIKVWYQIFPRESIEPFVQNFAMFKSAMASQLNEMSEGEMKLEDLRLSGYEMGSEFAAFHVTGRVVGDFAEAVTALSTKGVAPSVSGVPTTPTTAMPEDLIKELKEVRYFKTRSSDFAMTFDKEELAFKASFNGINDGDVDKQVNAIKDIYLKYLPQIVEMLPEASMVINNFLLPTNVSVVNLKMNFDYTFDGEKHNMNFNVEGMKLKPPNAEALLYLIEEMLAESPMLRQPDFNLTLESGSTVDELVEIVVPPITAEPKVKTPYRVVWSLDNVTNLGEVSFEVKPNVWGVEDFTLHTASGVIQGAEYTVNIATNSTIVEVADVAENEVVVKVSGVEGTKGALTMSLPVVAGVVRAKINDIPIEPTVTKTDTEYLVHLTYTHSVSTIVVRWVPPALVLVTDKTDVTVGETSEFKGTLTAEEGVLAGRSISIKVNGNLVGTVETDSDGSFTYSYKFKEAGDYEVNAVYDYFEKSFESSTTSIAVVTPFLTPEIMIAIGVPIVVAVVVLSVVLAKRRRKIASSAT